MTPDSSPGMRELAAGGSCLAENAWICPEYVRTRSAELTEALTSHLVLTGVSVLLGILVSVPLAILAHRVPRLATPVLGATTVLYTIPSLAVFSLLIPVFGLAASVTVAGMVLYSLTVLVRNLLAGLQSVPDEVVEAATGMGYGPFRRLLTVELPLALPPVMAGVRVATVSTVSLVTVGGLYGEGGLGNLIYEGMSNDFKAQVLTASVLCVLIAVTADLLLLGLQWLLTPWTHGRGKPGRPTLRPRTASRRTPGPDTSAGLAKTAGPAAPSSKSPAEEPV